MFVDNVITSVKLECTFQTDVVGFTEEKKINYIKSYIKEVLENVFVDVKINSLTVKIEQNRRKWQK